MSYVRIRQTNKPKVVIAEVYTYWAKDKYSCEVRGELTLDTSGCITGFQFLSGNEQDQNDFKHFVNSGGWGYEGKVRRMSREAGTKEFRQWFEQNAMGKRLEKMPWEFV